MSIKSISSIVLDPEIDAIAVQTAIELADRMQAHLDVHCFGIDPTRYESVPIGGAPALTQSGLVEARAQAEQLESWAEKKLVGSLDAYGVSRRVVSHLGLDRPVTQLARYCDIAVASKPYGAGHRVLQSITLEALLFGAQVPVMIVPDNMTQLPEFNRITFAWNESDEALNAARAALPLLRQASQVDIVVVDPPAQSAERSEPGGQVSLWLARHGVKCEVSILSKSLPRISDVLMRFAAEHGSDLLLMGAYGHSRFREALLGGVTRDVLEDSELMVMMSH